MFRQSLALIKQFSLKKFESVGRIKISFYFEILFFRGPVVTPDEEVNA